MLAGGSVWLSCMKEVVVLENCSPRCFAELEAGLREWLNATLRVTGSSDGMGRLVGLELLVLSTN